MIDIYGDLEEWFKDRPKWIQEAAKFLVEKESLSEEEILSLIKLCDKESKGEAVSCRAVQRNELSFGEASENIKLKKIFEVSGINDLNPKNPLIFGDSNLSIVYGGNGSGKSGYTRTLKHICGAKHLGKLLGNVFKQKDEKLKCKILITRDCVPQEYSWSPDNGIIKDLSSIEIFDSNCADVYATKENEVAYEPFILRLFTRLTDLCVVLADRFEKVAFANQSTKPSIPPEFLQTASGIWYGKIGAKTKDQEIESNCEWNDLNESQLTSTTERLAIANPADQAKQVRRIKKNLEDLKSKLLLIDAGLSDSSCEVIIALKSAAVRKRKIVEQEAKKVFENAALDDIGNDAWKALWNAARKYSEGFAYKDAAFPNVDENALCVLCHQPLDADSKTRFLSFEQFVSGSLEKDALEAETDYSNAINELPNVPQVDEIKSTMDASGIIDEAIRAEVIQYIAKMGTRKNWILTATSKEGLPVAESFKFYVHIDTLSTSLEEKAKAHDSDSQGENRAALEKTKLELLGKKWVSQQVVAIRDEIARLKLIDQIKKAKQLTSTQPLSLKKSSLSEILLSAEYLKRFKEELKKLGGNRIQAEIVKTRADKGKVFHQLVLSNKIKAGSIDEILSHGEYRIVSLAAFLADAVGRGSNSPFIFDDPISSLDQEYEDRLVDRLVELSKTRQVIVFTHRLSLLSSLVDASSKENIEPSEICIRSESWGKGEPGETSFFAKKPEKVLNLLKSERLARAKKVLAEMGQSEYEILAKGICSDFRILIERIVETVLISEVVLRFRRSIVTKDKLDKLSRIKIEDCRMLDGMMTKYSKYEHSQSQETPVELPTPSELEVDIKAVIDWSTEFKARQ